MLTLQWSRGAPPFEWRLSLRSLITTERTTTLTDNKPQDHLFHSLARAVARGQSISAWLNEHQCTVDTARELCHRPEFPQLVDRYRLDDAQEFVLELKSSAVKAIHTLSTIVQQKGNPSRRLAAARALVEKWIESSMYLEQEEKIEALAERVRILEESRGLNISGVLRNSRN
jgi:hypothetical protein